LFHSSRAPCNPPVALELDARCDINADDVDGKRVELVAPAYIQVVVDEVCRVELLLYLEYVVDDEPKGLNSFN